MRGGCPFCDYAGPSEILMNWDSAIVIEPLNPCVPGHKLVIPKKHAEFLWEDLDVATALMRDVVFSMRGLEYNGRCNVIVNDGAIATQTVKHVHVHLVPRYEDDGVKLPWTYQDKDPNPTMDWALEQFEKIVKNTTETAQIYGEGEQRRHFESKAGAFTAAYYALKKLNVDAPTGKDGRP